jgi:phosphate transport system substrate-binding protein
MKYFISFFIFFVFSSFGAGAQGSKQNEVVITGARFTYPLVENWINEYREAAPSANIRIEPRTTVDPDSYDILIEAYEPDELVREDREYLYLGRYAVLPVANGSSAFAKHYGDDGLNTDLAKQIFFHDIYAKEDQDKPREAYRIYTRLQKAGAPKTFAKHFGFDQQHIIGKAIAGADEHLIKAILKDTLGVSYSLPSLLYDLDARKPLKGLTILPLDADNNGRVSKDEKFYGNLDDVISKLENSPDEVRNIPVEYFHISIRKHGHKPEALKFLIWIIENSQDDLHRFGFLKPNQKRFDAEKEKFEQLAVKK